MDISRYRDLFVSEANEHLKFLSSLSMRCEEGAIGSDTIHELFRHAHSLKGMAATMQLTPITTLSHALEDLFDKVREGQFRISRSVADLILSAIDTLEQMVALVAQEGELPDTEDLANRIRNYTPAIETETHESAPALYSAPQPANTQDFSFRTSDDSATTRIKTSLLDRLVTLSGELLTVRHTIENKIQQSKTEGMTQPLKELSALLRQLQNEVFQARMLPFGSIAERYPRMIRDLAHKSGKEINFRIQGDGIELDRGVLEQIIEPLVHLLRNAVDHGLETPAERVACGKPPVGSLCLTVTRLTDQVLLEVTDDGRGMYPAKIRAKAIAQGLLNEEQASMLSAEEILLLVCTPGFSTAATVTEISGRGVGMDVVQSTIKTIGGTLSIDSIPGHGSTIALRLPLSVAIIHALLVSCGKLILAVPVSAITSTCEVPLDRIIQKGRHQFFEKDGQQIPLRNLPVFFRQNAIQPEHGVVPVLLTESNKQPVGLLVDRLLGQQEIFTRPLSHPLADLRGISGSCLMGNGQIVFVVDPNACSSRTYTEN
jgi:two-component system chemotaxis sensor kinase CheA